MPKQTGCMLGKAETDRLYFLGERMTIIMNRMSKIKDDGGWLVVGGQRAGLGV